MTICLNMIVKDEVSNMERCLKSVDGIIDKYVIVDTGSTDGTQKLIKKLLKGKDLILHKSTWVNFEHNRNEALQLAYKSGCQYVLIMDADWECQHLKGVFQNLTTDSYLLDIQHGALRFKQPLLLGLHKTWRWEGETHSYISGDGSRDCLHDVLMLSYPGEGCTSKGISDRDKFLHDADLLEERLKREPNNPRWIFYLAQSYKDAGEYQKARDLYLKRISLGGWEEEIYWSLYQTATCQWLISVQFPLDEFLKAYNFRPQRLEALYEIVRYYRLHAQYDLPYALASKCEIKMPDDILFIPVDIYDWRLKDEIALCAYNLGKYIEAQKIWYGLLSSGKLPESENQRIIMNKDWAVGKNQWRP